MSPSQLARSQYNTRQQSRLTLCLGMAIVAHGLLFLGWTWERRENRRIEKDPIGVEFVYLDPAANESEETESSRRAQVNSAAGGNRNEDLPISAGRRSQNTALPTVPNRPIPPNPAQSASQPIAANPVPVPPSPRSSPETQGRSDIQQRTLPPPTVPRSAQPALPQAPTVSRPPNPAGATAQPINPQNGQGLDGQINPDRPASGTASIEAAADGRWGTYVSTLNRKIDQNWQRISVSALRQAKVQFEIDRQGRLLNLRLVESSGDASADTVAIQAVRLAAPFTPFPAQTTEARLRVNFTFTYYPADGSPASQSLDSLQPLTPAQ